jgi:hypothetical protein
MCACCALPYHTSHSVENLVYHHLFTPSPHASLPQPAHQHPYAQLSPLPLAVIGYLHARSASFYVFYAQTLLC